jgi:hypothetical protein
VFTELDDTHVFGSNSTSSAYTSADESAAMRLRNILVEKYPHTFPANDDIGQTPNNALFHAETTVLLRAARHNRGTLSGQTLTVAVDARMCNKLFR